MARYISFALTTPQFRARTKTVTRRLGWKWLVSGTLLRGAEKCQGLGKGGKIKPLDLIRAVEVRPETLDCMIEHPEYGATEAALEGFPGWTGEQFVDFFCKANRCPPDQIVTRIQFEYVDPPTPAK